MPHAGLAQCLPKLSKRSLLGASLLAMLCAALPYQGAHAQGPRNFATLAMVAEPGMIEFSPHKWASIEETHVFPVRPMVSLIMVRLTVAVLLIGLALVVSGLRRVFKK